MNFRIALPLLLVLALIGCSSSPTSAPTGPWTAPDLNPVTFHNADVAQPPVTLVQDGRPIANLCLMGNVDHEALEELQRCIKLATGAELTVIRNEIKDPALVIGDVPGIDTKALAPEALVIKTEPNRVLVTGKGQAGQTWAIYEFLERYVGARWYWPGDLGRSVPQSKTLIVPAVYLTDAPVFQRRELWPNVGNPNNGTGIRLDPLHHALRSGNSYPINLQVHTPDYAKNEDYKKNRPEIFQLNDAGTRDYSMLCYSNPRTLETFLENIQKRLDGDDKIVLGLIGNTITVSPNDHEVNCQCPDCRRLWDASAGAEGSASKIVASFTRNLALEVQKRWPNMNVLQLAYLNYTQCPVGVGLPDNVHVMICGMPGMALYSQPEIFDREQANIDKWFKLTGKKVQNWLYICWPEDRAKAVFLNPHTLQKYYRLNRDKTSGSFINGGGDHWPRQGLNCYTWLKLLWNPDFNVDAAIDEYCRRLYGPASNTMRELINLQIEGWEEHSWPTPRLTNKNVYTCNYPKETRDRMKQLLDQARQQAASDSTALKRIEYYATPFPDFFQEGDETQNPGPRTALNILHVDQNPTIAGKLDEECWSKASPVSFIPGVDRDKKVKYPTTLRAVWTDNPNAGVTFAVDCSDTAPPLITHPNIDRDHPDAMWWDDCLELLFDPTGKNDGDFYYLMTSAASCIADAHGDDFTFNAPGTTVATHAKTDGGYTQEIFIPFADLPSALRPDKSKQVTWQGNFTRHRCGDFNRKIKAPGTKDEYQRLNTTFAGPTTNLADFGPLNFLPAP